MFPAPGKSLQLKQSTAAVLKGDSGMASPVPAKSQPLHNFDLPRTLKWNKDGKSSTNHHHRRRHSLKSPSRRPHSSPVSPLRHSTPPPHLDPPYCAVRSSPIRLESSSKWARQPLIGGDSACHFQRRDSVVTESNPSVMSKGVAIGYRRNHSKNPERGTEKFEKKKSRALEIDSAGIKRSSKIYIKIPCKNNKSEDENPNDNPLLEEKKPLKVEISDEGNNHAENSIDEEAKTWNLRPRKPLCKSLNVNGGGVTVKNKAQSPSKILNNNKPGENEGHGCNGGGVEKEKRKLTINIALKKEEIEEDIFAFTGSKPSRRPKKRPRNIQKQLDYAFPGLWLVSITPDSYKVSENSMKG